MIFNVDSNCAHLRFSIRPLMYNIVYDFIRILIFLRKSTCWNHVLWPLVVLNAIPGDSWCRHKSPGDPFQEYLFPIHSGVLIDVGRFLMFLHVQVERVQVCLSVKVSRIIGVMVRRTLLQGTSFRNQRVLTQVGPDIRKCRFNLSNRIQIKHSRFLASWFSTSIPYLLIRAPTHDRKY